MSGEKKETDFKAVELFWKDYFDTIRAELELPEGFSKLDSSRIQAIILGRQDDPTTLETQLELFNRTLAMPISAEIFERESQTQNIAHYLLAAFYEQIGDLVTLRPDKVPDVLMVSPEIKSFPNISRAKYAHIQRALQPIFKHWRLSPNEIQALKAYKLLRFEQRMDCLFTPAFLVSLEVTLYVFLRELRKLGLSSEEMQQAEARFRQRFGTESSF